MKYFLSALTLLSVIGCGTPVPSQGSETSKTSSIEIQMPVDFAAYKTAMVEHAQVGGPNPLDTWTFEPVSFEIPATEDIARATAEKAVEQIPIGNKQGKPATIVYWTVIGTTAYMLLDIQQDAWAGISATLAVVDPIIVKSLTALPNIDTVVFDKAPIDKSS